MAAPKGQPKPPGSGRKAGTPNKATRAKQQLLQSLVAENLQAIPEDIIGRIPPLDILLMAMHSSFKAGQIESAAAFARDAAPYIHPRLASTDTTIKSDNVHHVISDKPLSEDEWLASYTAPAAPAVNDATETADEAEEPETKADVA